MLKKNFYNNKINVISDLCSHWRSWRYYAESVNNEKAFPAYKCNLYVSYLSDSCDKDNNVIYFGYSVPPNA